MKISILLLASFMGVCFCADDISSYIVNAVNEAKKTVIKDMAKEETLGESETPPESQRANAQSQDDQIRGTILLETTKILVEKFGIEILPTLEEFDMDKFLPEEKSNESTGARKKRQAAPCPKDSTDCSNPKYRNFRSVTGVCNNLQHPQRGAAVTKLRRIARKTSFADGIGAIRNQSIQGDELPSTREVSNVINDINDDSNVFDLETNHMHMQAGQFAAHDMIFMPSSVGLNFENLDCSTCDSALRSTNCAPIPVPSDDEYFPQGSCIRLTRALNGQKGLGQRQPINQNTHFLDLSSVYGSEECESASVRSFIDGQLKVIEPTGFPLPPQDKNSVDPSFCFRAGDFRNSLHPGLVPFHTVMIKEHNRIARQISAARPEENDEQIYQETRRIMIAQWQHVIYNEYLPKLFGKRNTMLRTFDLEPLRSGFYKGYDQDIDASLSYEFAAAAFRFGHSQVRENLPRVSNANRTLAKPIDLGSNFFYTESLYDKAAGGTESILEGMIHCPAWKVDNQFAFPIRNQLFEIREKKASGVDLIAVNMMRGRDVGLLPYNEYRQLVGFDKKATSFEDLVPDMGKENVKLLKEVYSHVDDIDLYPGMLMEKPMPGALSPIMNSWVGLRSFGAPVGAPIVADISNGARLALMGRTGLSIIGDTFSNLKRGDRFYYENQASSRTKAFTADQLQAIRRTTLAKIICESTSTMTVVNEDIFDLKSRRVLCSSLESLDMRPFIGRNPRTKSTRTPRPTRVPRRERLGLSDN